MQLICIKILVMRNWLVFLVLAFFAPSFALGHDDNHKGGNGGWSRRSAPSPAALEQVVENLPEQVFLVLAHKGRAGSVEKIYKECKDQSGLLAVWSNEKISFGYSWDEWKHVPANELVLAVYETATGNFLYIYFLKEYQSRYSLPRPALIGRVVKKHWLTRGTKKIFGNRYVRWVPEILLHGGGHFLPLPLHGGH